MICCVRRRQKMIVVDQNIDNELNLSSEIYSKNDKTKKRGIKNIQPNIDGLGGKYGWIVRGDQKPTEKRVPFTKPTFKQICNSLPFIWRYSFFWLKNIHRREKLFINTYQPLKHRPFYGVPCGGIGSGSIGRDFRGAFCKFSLIPGFVEQRSNSVKADQFILNVSKEEKTVKQIVLSSAFSGNESTLNSWDFSFPKENLAYRGLYPRSWTKFDFPDLKLRIVLRQISPIIPNNYKDSAFPGTIFVFDVENNSDENYQVSITFTFRNGTGKRRQNDDATCSTSEFQTDEVSGVLLKQKIDKMDCVYSICGKITDDVEISNCTGFDPNGNGKIFWNLLAENCGKLQGKIENCSNAIALSMSSRIKPSKTTKMEFSLIWHMPTVYFGSRKRPLKRWYTRHFGISSDSAITMSEYGLRNYNEWEKQINEWQNPILEHPNIPNWFKSALFNELYFLSDGGSVWFDYDEKWMKQEKHLSDYTRKLLMEYGRFGYLESWEYRMINTYDVHFYASFALAELFPKLEHVIQAEMTDNIHNAEEKLVKFHMEGDIAPIKTYHRVPHDLGNPAKDPWMFTNAYVMHNTALWKDLNLKFILTSYRDYYLVLNKSKEFLNFVWPTIKTLIEEGLKNWDRDDDGMIENFGLADQTYDAWRMIGVSSYCGSLWLSSLRVAIEMAKDVEDDEHFKRYTEILEMAKKVFDEKLWNGKYYNFDESTTCSKTVMADQLCGYWYLQSINPELVEDLLPKEHVQSSLETIYAYNVMKFGNGKLGAVNGMRPNGKVDHSYIQTDEIWTGITYALGSFFIQQGDEQRGFDVAFGIYDTCFNRSGLQYQTPEALYKKHYYRAIGYMRPLSIWSIYAALKKNCRLFDKNCDVLNGIRVEDPFYDNSNIDETSSDSEVLLENGSTAEKNLEDILNSKDLQENLLSAIKVD